MPRSRAKGPHAYDGRAFGATLAGPSVSGAALARRVALSAFSGPLALSTPLALSAPLAFSTLLAFPTPAHAFTFESNVTTGCHEAITVEALREARGTEGLGAVLAAVPYPEDARGLSHELPFHVDAADDDFATAALLFGVRDPDLKGVSGTDSSRLAIVHGNPYNQKEHCLRAPDEDEPEGSARAIAECLDVIREHAIRAIDEGLTVSGAVALDRRETVPAYLTTARTVDLSLPLFYVELGRALHTLQDSFSHAYRRDVPPTDSSVEPGACDRGGLRTQVTVVLNWAEFAEERLREERDGPRHMFALDQCQLNEPLVQARRAEAARATKAMLAAVADPRLDRAAKLAAIDCVLATHIEVVPGCTAANDWCQASEERMVAVTKNCASTGRGAGGAGAAVAITVVAALALRRRRAMLAAGLASTLWATTAKAEPPTPTPTPTPGPDLRARPPLLLDERSPWTVEADIGVAVDNPAFALGLGGAYAMSATWLAGARVEWNPWLGNDARGLVAGSAAVYAFLVRRWLISDAVNLRTRLEGGTAIQLFDAYGALAGSVGLYAGISLLGVEIPINGRVRLLLDPAHIAVPVPHLTGLPLAYRQYRVTVGFEWTP